MLASGSNFRRNSRRNRNRFTAIWIVTDARADLIAKMKAQYLMRCPLYNLFRKSGCVMIENWHIEPVRR